MFNEKIELKEINELNKANMVGYLGIEFLEYGDNYLKAKMPVDHRTKQPMGLLHGGASVVLAETLGSFASYLLLENPNKQSAVGLEINANHLKSATEGWVYGTATPIHIGKSTHLWDIKITNEKEEVVCVSRLTVMIKTLR